MEKQYKPRPPRTSKARPIWAECVTGSDKVCQVFTLIGDNKYQCTQCKSVYTRREMDAIYTERLKT